MLYPVCPTCGFLLADKELKFKAIMKEKCNEKKNNDIDVEKIFKELKVKRYCCRMRMITYLDLIDYII